jgi:membrane-associated phospholipid phosphatase
MPAQPAFRLHPLGDGLALSAGLGLTLAGYRLNQQLLPLSPANLQGLNTSGLPRIDRFATAYYRPSVAAVSDWIAVAAVAVPAICLRSEYIRQRLPTVGLMAAEGALWTSGLTLLTKGLTQRLRPYVYNAAVAPEEKMTADSRRSYFSGHVAMAAYTTFAGASLYSQVYPDRRAKWVIWAAAALLPDQRAAAHLLNLLILAQCLQASATDSHRGSARLLVEKRSKLRRGRHTARLLSIHEAGKDSNFDSVNSGCADADVLRGHPDV